MSVTLVTGCAGFIGMHCAQALLARGEQVVGIDNLNAYYEVSLKEARLARLLQHPGFTFERTDVADRQAMRALFERVRPTRVLHLAAQAGVRYSIDQPDDYTDSNLLGFGNILQGCRAQQVAHLVFASSSSVYGGNARLPYSERDAVDHPISYYAATKKANEVMAHSYAHLYGLPTTGLRFFTVYGPWGRPDMALFKFTKAILEGRAIDVYNHGDMRRDFTYIDDIAEAVVRLTEVIPQRNPEWSVENGTPAESSAPYRVYNIGNHKPEQLMHFIEVLEQALGKTAEKEYLPMQAGDVYQTYADVSELQRDFDFKPETTIEEGLSAFAAWYRMYYGL